MEPPSIAVARPDLDRLVVNVSRDCNLRCRYCYADGGSYGGARSLLTPERGLGIADYFLATFPRIGSIQFFGGEPFLNVGVLDAICAHVLARCDETGVPPPRFSVVSNGTIVTEDVLDVIRRRGLFVTVSLDGPREINDLQRVSASGEGSFDRVVESIRILKRETGQPSQVEGTFTARHLDAGFSLAAFMDFLVEELEVHVLHMPYILGDGFGAAGIGADSARLDALVATYSEAIARSVRSLSTPDLETTILLSFVERYLRAQLSEAKDSPLVCAAGTGTISVDVDGAIYPCFMFTNKLPFRLGVVGTTSPGELRMASLEFASRLVRSPGDGPRPLMSCAGMNEELAGAVDRCLPAATEVNRRLVARLDEELAPYRRDEERWSWLKTKLALLQVMAG